MNRLIRSEEDVQRLVYDYPWLLDINFEKIDSKPLNNGWEVQLSGANRIDVLFKHRITNRPVVVEFKHGDFYRSNIGQILDYRARILNEIHDPESEIVALFKEKVFSPILCLVVKSCDEYARSACNLAGIEIYEYKNKSRQISFDIDEAAFKRVNEIMENDEIMFNVERPARINEIYARIRNVLSTLKIEQGWKDYRKPAGEYWYPLNHLFINKWLLEDEDISLGIYENIFENHELINIDFYSTTEDVLTSIEQELKRLTCFKNAGFRRELDESENYLTFTIPKKYFINNIEKVIKEIVAELREIKSK